jgi:hypothetical protein
MKSVVSWMRANVGLTMRRMVSFYILCHKEWCWFLIYKQCCFSTPWFETGSERSKSCCFVMTRVKVYTIQFNQWQFSLLKMGLTRSVHWRLMAPSLHFARTNLQLAQQLRRHWRTRNEGSKVWLMLCEVQRKYSWLPNRWLSTRVFWEVQCPSFKMLQTFGFRERREILSDSALRSYTTNTMWRVQTSEMWHCYTLTFTICFLAWLTLQLLRQAQYVPPKHQTTGTHPRRQHSQSPSSVLFFYCYSWWGETESTRYCGH